MAGTRDIANEYRPSFTQVASSRKKAIKKTNISWTLA